MFPGGIALSRFAGDAGDGSAPDLPRAGVPAGDGLRVRAADVGLDGNAEGGTGATSCAGQQDRLGPARRIHLVPATRCCTRARGPSSFRSGRLSVPCALARQSLSAPVGIEAEPARLAEFIAAARVTAVHFVPSLLAEFLGTADSSHATSSTCTSRILSDPT